MHFQSSIVLFLPLVAIGVIGKPVADPGARIDPNSNIDFKGIFQKKSHPQQNSSNPNCPSQPPSSASNACSSGSPYCCSGSGASTVCGPASSTTCSSSTICCINTNGMQICAGEIDFTGPVTININV